MTPNNIDRYEVHGEIGRGGMAAVLKGFDPRFKRDVAIKLLPREFLHDPQFRARFQLEAQTIATLEHPAIVPVYDFGDADGQLYLVMRLMNGGSMAERLEKRPFSISETARIFDRLAPALDSAHSMGIIHRDLKPANILFDQWDNPYFSDFGIAKLVASSSTALTATGGLIGTPAYMSPEQVRGVDKLDGRSDIYAMGVILFQMLTGQLPYNANTPIGLAFMHVTEPIPSILDVDSSLPHAYQTVIGQAMAKERGARYQTTVALADAISGMTYGEDSIRTILDSDAKETIVDPLPDRVETELVETEQLEIAEQEPPNTKDLPLTALEEEYRQAKWGPNEPNLRPQASPLPQPVMKSSDSLIQRVPVWAWGVIGLIVVVGLYGLFGGQDGRWDEPVEPEQTFAISTPEPTGSLINASPALEGTAIPQQAVVEVTQVVTEIIAEGGTTVEVTRIITALEESAASQSVNALTPDIVGIELDLVYEIQVNDSTNDFQAVACLGFSPDSKQFVTCGSALNIWSVDDGSKIDSWVEQYAHGDIAYSANGKFIAVASASSVLQIYNSADGSLYNSIRTPESGSANLYGDVDFSPNGELLAVGRLHDAIDIFSTETWELIETLETSLFISDVKFSSNGQYLASGNAIWRVSDWSSMSKNPAVDARSIDFSSNSEFLAIAADWDGTLIFNPANYELIFKDESQSSAVAFSPIQNLLASSFDEYVSLFLQVDDGWISRKYQLPQLGPIGLSNNSSIAFSPDGTLLAIGRIDGSVLLYRVSWD